MGKAARVVITEADLSFSVATIVKGVSGVSGITKRGAFANPELLQTTWANFLKEYGGFIDSSQFPILCQRIFNRGGQLRVSRVGHYTDVTDASTLTAEKGALPKVTELAFDASFVASNVYNLLINAVGIDAVTFDSSSDKMLQDIADSIALHSAVESTHVVKVAGTAEDDRVILIYSDPTAADLTLAGSAVTGGASQAGTTTTQFGSGIMNSNNDVLFNLVPKHEGVDYNNLLITIADATNGGSEYFDLIIEHILEPSLRESYPNLKISGAPTVAQSNYLFDIYEQSSLVDITYSDVSGVTTPIRPVNRSYRIVGGSDGGTVLITDYTGDQAARTGLYAFDPVDDIMQVCAPEISDTTLHVAGAAYAAARTDLIYVAHLSNGLKTPAALIAARAATNIDSSYTFFTAGGLKIIHPTTGVEIEISEAADVLGVFANSDFNFGEHYSPAGPTRGLIPGALGVVNNFGSTGQYNDLNLLAGRNINMVINRDNRIMLWGNITAQLAQSHLSQVNARRFIIFLRKTLRPTLERFLQDPNDIPTWRRIFYTVKPTLDGYVTDRALFEYDWAGDQFAESLDDLSINNKTDVGNGKYKVILSGKIIPAMIEFEVQVNITPTSVSFEDLSLIDNTTTL